PEFTKNAQSLSSTQSSSSKQKFEQMPCVEFGSIRMHTNDAHSSSAMQSSPFSSRGPSPEPSSEPSSESPMPLSSPSSPVSSSPSERSSDASSTPEPSSVSCVAS